MSIEFNGNKEIRISNPDVDPKSKALIAQDTVKLNPSEIGDLLRSRGAQTVNYIDEDKIFNLAESMGLVKRHEPTPEEREAMSQLNEKVSSTGISYGDANKKIDEIREKYNDDKYYTEVIEERQQPRGTLIYYPPVKRRVFDESKLPEPARTEYREAMDAQEEILNNNAALARKAGLQPQGRKEPPVSTGGNVFLEEAIAKLTGNNKPELTEKQKAARAKLDEKQSSTGVSYKEAQALISELTEKYKDSCVSKFESPQPKDLAIYMAPYEAFDPYKIPEPDRTAYFDALASIHEIEAENSALVKQGGLPMTPQPSQNYAGMRNHIRYD